MRGLLSAVVLLASIAALASPAIAVQAPGTQPLRVGGSIKFPTRIQNVNAVYPAEAQQARVSGVVIIECTIGEDGSVRDAVVRRSIPLLDQAALDAVRRWKYTPTIVDGVAVPVIITVTVNFALQGENPPAGPAGAATIRLTSFRHPDGTSSVWEIESARASRLPRWNPETETPLLTPPELTRIARAWFAERNPQARLTLQNVNLSQARGPGGVDFWWYQLSFFGTDQTQSGPLIAVVLPDGSVVAPSEGSSAVPVIPPAR